MTPSCIAGEAKNRRKILWITDATEESREILLGFVRDLIKRCTPVRTALFAPVVAIIRLAVRRGLS